MLIPKTQWVVATVRCPVCGQPADMERRGFLPGGRPLQLCREHAVALTVALVEDLCELNGGQRELFLNVTGTEN